MFAVHRELNIIHTDFKPENVMLVDTLEPRHWEMDVPVKGAAQAAVAAPTQSSGSSGLSKNQKKKARQKAKKAAARHPDDQVGTGAAWVGFWVQGSSKRLNVCSTHFFSKLKGQHVAGIEGLSA